VLALFNCITVDGVSYLVADTTLLCSDDRYSSFLPIGLFGILLYPVGIPLTFLGLLLRFRKSLHRAAVKPWLGFVSESYRDGAVFFELLDMACKLIL
jgi:hypothetical protein